MRLRISAIFSLSLMVIACVDFTACTKSAPAVDSGAVTDGRQVFLVNCSSCHNINPNLPGSLGPPIAGSPRGLIEARVLHQAYPPGYHPQRASHLMRAMPWLAPKVDDLTAFLAAAKRDQK